MKGIKSLLIGAILISLLSGCQTVGSAVKANRIIKAVELNLEDFDRTATIEEQVLYDKDGIKITATSLTYNSYEAILNLVLENNTSEKYSITSATGGYSCNAINDWMDSSGYLVEYLDPGEKREANGAFPLEDLEVYGIYQIGSIQMGFTISPERPSKQDIYTGPIEIQTSAYGINKDEPFTAERMAGIYKTMSDDQGKVTLLKDKPVYEEHGVTITPIAFIDRPDSKQLIVTCENNNSEQVDLMLSGASVNGYAISSVYLDGNLVNPAKKAVYVLDYYRDYDLSSDNWKVLDIQNVSELGFGVDLKDKNYDKLEEYKWVYIELAQGAKKEKSEDIGQNIYEDHGLTIIDKGAYQFDEKRETIDWKLIVRNDNEYPVRVDGSNRDALTVNGRTIRQSYYGNVIQPHRAAVITISADIESLKANQIDLKELGQAEISLEISNEETKEIIDKPVLSAELKLNQ